MGGVGFTKDYPIEKYYRDCKIGELPGKRALRDKYWLVFAHCLLDYCLDHKGPEGCATKQGQQKQTFFERAGLKKIKKLKRNQRSQA